MSQEKKSVSPETERILRLTNEPYDNNSALAEIKKRLGEQKTMVFEQILVEELPYTTGKRAFRTAIKIAMGERDVYRDAPQDPTKRKNSRSAQKTEA
jgi:hypothetical protein